MTIRRSTLQTASPPSDRLAGDQLAGDPLAGLVSGPPVPLRHPGRWVACVLVALLGVWFFWTVVTNPNFEWPVVGQYLFSPEILAGVQVTIELTVTAMIIGVAMGIVIALMRLSDNRLLSWSAMAYIAFFRGTPTLVQIVFWFNLSALFPTIGIGLPFGPSFFSINANALITPLIAANLGLGLCEGAYMAEIVRGGILSVDPGQREASSALGLSRAQTMRRVVLPQALRVIVPPTGNEVIGMMKYTSLASVISVTELLTSAQLVYTRTYQTIPLLIVASLWYVALTAVLTFGQRLVERRVGRSQTDAAAPRKLGPAIWQNLFQLRRAPASRPS